jgi:uncharacterized lipoprotein YddW (UPF0748 family)
MARVLLLLGVTLSLATLPAAAESRKGELRGAWMRSGYNRGWPAIMKSLQENGFNALFPNLFTGGAAWYPSKVLPPAAGATKGRDELALAAKAAKQYGIELHVWRINWMTEGIPPDVLKQYEKDGRLMRNTRGQLVRDDPQDSLKMDWLCPSNPANRKLEKDAMLEVVRKYDIAGIQFDYMRFPRRDYCFCDHCKEQFTQDTGIKPGHWPDDVVQGGMYGTQYEEWRWGLQTSLVKEISTEAHRLKPNLRVSLAAWPNAAIAHHWVLQDWPAWVKNGSLDFICFMDYADSSTQVAQMLAPDVDLIAGAIPIYAGLGAFMLKDPAALIDQIKASRQAGADGFVAFAYGSGDLEKWLPRIHTAVADTDPNPMPHWSPPARFEFSGPALDAPFTARQVKAGASLRVDVKLGKAIDSEDDGGLAQAARVPSHATTKRQPMPDHTVVPNGPTTGTSYSLSGEVVIEDANGLPLAKLALFDAGRQLARSFTFTAPTGPFRLAIYGAEQDAAEHIRDFVARGPLLTGLTEAPAPAPAPQPQAELTPEQAHGELARLCAALPARAKPEQLAGMNGAVLLHATGPGGGDWWLRLADGKCTSGEGALDNPQLTVTGSAQDLLAVAQAQADAFALWTSGRIAVAGDFALMTKLMALLTVSAGM